MSKTLYTRCRRTCMFQILFKFLVIMILCLWIIIETCHLSNDMDGINSLSSHLVSSPKSLRVLYTSLLCATLVVFCVVYIWLPSLFMPMSYTISMIVFTLFLVFFFSDLFLSYTSYTQFYRYHNKLFFILALFILCLCWFHTPQRRSVHLVLFGLTLFSCIVFFGRFHYMFLHRIDDREESDVARHFRAYGLCQFFFLCLLVSIIPMACPDDLDLFIHSC